MANCVVCLIKMIRRQIGPGMVQQMQVQRVTCDVFLCSVFLCSVFRVPFAMRLMPCNHLPTPYQARCPDCSGEGVMVKEEDKCRTCRGSGSEKKEKVYSLFTFPPPAARCSRFVDSVRCN